MGTQRHISSSSRAVRGRKSQIQHTHHTLRFTNTHLHSSLSDQHSPSGCPAPLPRCLSPLPTPQVPRSPAGLTGCSLPTCSSHTLVPLPGHTHGSPPKHQHCPAACQIPHPHLGPPTPGVLGLPVNPHQHTMHSCLGQGTWTLPQKPASQDGPDAALSPSLTVH